MISKGLGVAVTNKSNWHLLAVTGRNGIAKKALDSIISLT